MGRPRNFENSNARSRVARALSESSSRIYNASFLDGAAVGYREGYESGFDDRDQGKPNRFKRDADGDNA